MSSPFGVPDVCRWLYFDADFRRPECDWQAALVLAARYTSGISSEVSPMKSPRVRVEA
jgi:hypothetical protein